MKIVCTENHDGFEFATGDSTLSYSPSINKDKVVVLCPKEISDDMYDAFISGSVDNASCEIEINFRSKNGICRLFNNGCFVCEANVEIGKNELSAFANEFFSKSNDDVGMNYGAFIAQKNMASDYIKNNVQVA